MDNPEMLSVFVSFRMRVSESAGDAAGDENRKFDGERMFLFAELVRELFEVHAANQFHGDEVDSACFAQVIGLNDVGMDEVGDEFCFADKVFNEDLLIGEILANDLDCNTLGETARAFLLTFVNNAHPAFAEFAKDLVVEVALDGEQPWHGAR